MTQSGVYGGGGRCGLRSNIGEVNLGTNLVLYLPYLPIYTYLKVVKPITSTDVTDLTIYLTFGTLSMRFRVILLVFVTEM